MRVIFIHTILFLLCNKLSVAQQHYNNTLYLYNHYSINPAAAGCNGLFNLNGQIRNQWNNQNLKGVSNGYLTGSLPLKRINGAAGLKITSYRTDLEKTGSLLLTYAHIISLNKGNLRMGIDFGGFSRELNTADYFVKHVNDPLIDGNIIQTNGLNANFGLYYHSQKLFAGASVYNLLGKNINYKAVSLYKPNKQLFFNGGYSFTLNKNYVLVPSLMVRFVSGTPLSSDLNLSLGYHLKTWVGLSLKSTGGYGIFVLLPINDRWRIGYTYEKLSAPIKGLQKLKAHELNFNYFFNSKVSKPVSFRYFN